MHPPRPPDSTIKSNKWLDPDSTMLLKFLRFLWGLQSQVVCRVLFKESCNLSVFWPPPETLEVPLWTQLVLKRATLLENFMSAQNDLWILHPSAFKAEIWFQNHIVLYLCCSWISWKFVVSTSQQKFHGKKRLRERERHKLTFEKSTVQRCYVEMAGKPEHHFFGQQNFFFPRRGSNCSPSVSAGGN